MKNIYEVALIRMLIAATLNCIFLLLIKLNSCIKEVGVKRVNKKKTYEKFSQISWENNNNAFSDIY